MEIYFLWGQHYPNTKTRDIIRKLQTNNASEHGCKNPPQNILKSNPTMYKKSSTPWPSGIYPRYARLVNIQELINAIHHIKKLRKENHTIVSVDAEKAFAKANTHS